MFEGLFSNGRWGRAIEKKDRTKEIVRWMSEEAWIPCALNLRYTEESPSVALLCRKERRGGVCTCIADGVFQVRDIALEINQMTV